MIRPTEAVFSLSPLATASNGRLLFIGFLMIGDTQKIERAIEVFNRFSPHEAKNL